MSRKQLPWCKFWRNSTEFNQARWHLHQCNQGQTLSVHGGRRDFPEHLWVGFLQDILAPYHKVADLFKQTTCAMLQH